MRPPLDAFRSFRAIRRRMARYRPVILLGQSERARRRVPREAVAKVIRLKTAAGRERAIQRFIREYDEKCCIARFKENVDYVADAFEWLRSSSA